MSLEDAVLSVWQQVFAENAKTVTLEGVSLSHPSNQPIQIARSGFQIRRYSLTWRGTKCDHELALG